MTSESLSTRMLASLRKEADESSRPKERNGTLSRLEEACNAIASGSARAIVGQGLPSAEVNFRRSPVRIVPPRIEEFVLAKRALDGRAGRIPSSWTGPTATTLRKDRKLLDYVRARDQELAAASGRFVPKTADKLLDDVQDLALRSELRLLLARGRQAETDLIRLRQGMRMLRPTVNIDLLIAGNPGQGEPESGGNALAIRETLDTHDVGRRLLSIASKLTNSSALSRFGLEVHPEFENIVERKTKAELLDSDETRILLFLARRAGGS